MKQHEAVIEAMERKGVLLVGYGSDDGPSIVLESEDGPLSCTCRSQPVHLRRFVQGLTVIKTECERIATELG